MSKITDSIFYLLTENDVDSFWKAFTDKYVADDEEMNEEFKKRLRKAIDWNSIIFEIVCLYEYYKIYPRELKKDLHYGRLVSIFEENYSSQYMRRTPHIEDNTMRIW